jgi:hypothetical protein
MELVMEVEVVMMAALVMLRLVSPALCIVSVILICVGKEHDACT